MSVLPVPADEERTVLVVDDEAELRDTMVEILRSEGIPAIGVSDGLEALRVVESQPISLVVLDLMMPGMDGRQVVASLRERGHELPVVLVSASRELRRVAQELGLPAVGKPFDLDDLVSVVQANRSQEHRALR